MARVIGTLRRNRLRYIERDPMTLTFMRVERTVDPVTGGRTPATTTTVGPYRCRLTRLRVDVALAGEQTEAVGQFFYANRYALVCPFGTDLRVGGQVRDNVDLAPYGSFSVREVVHETFEGQEYGVVAHLEVRT